MAYVSHLAMIRGSIRSRLGSGFVRLKSPNPSRLGQALRCPQRDSARSVYIPPGAIPKSGI